MIARIFGGFNGIDGEGVIHLTSVGSRRDLARYPNLKVGDRVVIYDYDREAEAVLDRRNDIWTARVDWDTMIDVTGRQQRPESQEGKR